jgi:toxin ParE1/3/4
MSKSAQPKYRLTRAADFDLEGIWRYTHKQWGARQASPYLRQLKRQIERVAKNPRHGQPRDDLSEGLRCAREGRHLILYRADEGAVITVIRVIHERMDIPMHVGQGGQGEARRDG